MGDPMMKGSSAMKVALVAVSLLLSVAFADRRDGDGNVVLQQPDSQPVRVSPETSASQSWFMPVMATVAVSRFVPRFSEAGLLPVLVACAVSPTVLEHASLLLEQISGKDEHDGADPMWSSMRASFFTVGTCVGLLSLVVVLFEHFHVPVIAGSEPKEKTKKQLKTEARQAQKQQKKEKKRINLHTSW